MSSQFSPKTEEIYQSDNSEGLLGSPAQLTVCRNYRNLP
jgi:hypothetical protein